MSEGAETVARATLWLGLGVWVGSWAFFAFVVSRIAFQTLPGDVAGDLAGRLLRVLQLGGAGLAVLVAAASIGLGRRGAIVALPLALAVVAAASELWLSPEIAAVRPSTLGPQATEATSLRFRQLHALSLGIFLVVHAASVALVVWHAHREARERRA